MKNINPTKTNAWKALTEQFNQAYKYAMNKGYVARNPMVDVIKPKSTKKDRIIRAMTIEEQQTFTKYLMSKLGVEKPQLAFEEDIMNAYDVRIKEFKTDIEFIG